ncbi:N-acetylglucosamine-6-phosphate deacetylase [Alkalihalobacillus sp. MEB130]|uniref:N-acetylglucosamine-6-phosphate deacetylase n=1 Tax=Alkalihalobacillus sp. MEB130 TaxID=2976704 RepID=UPI0028DE96DF|nr:N-acetylglucosamine-6-phosphate deacetylase [Alkalihalobacillus sp. MEB130]MDT8860372.1 N-acetylglucosamine-6-phosphate deacetylase [Alkalihalobacillus sp. MEB130]
MLLKNVDIYTENGWIKNGYILVNGTKIEAIGPMSDFQISDFTGEVLDGNGLLAIPGFIDSHIHGANGADVMDATPEALTTMAKALPAEGTTNFLATTITQSPENIEKALLNVAQFQNHPAQAEVLGVHLEGPFIEKDKAGAQPKEYVIEPSIEQFKKWQQLSGNHIKTITIAPEKDVDRTFITYLASTGVNVSAGHTNAGIEIMKEVVQAGVNQATHLCNAMTGIHHRDIGVVGAAFLLEDIQAEIIVDGIHVSKEMIRLIYKTIGPERLLLITDSIRAKGLAPGTYDLGGQLVEVDLKQATLPDGTLAGSIVKMIDAVTYMRDFTGATIEDLIRMASTNPAKQLGVEDRKGSIAVGKDADLLLVDQELSIQYTFCQGRLAYKAMDF